MSLLTPILVAGAYDSLGAAAAAAAPKADKVANAHAGDVAVLDADGNLDDGGVAMASKANAVTVNNHLNNFANPHEVNAAQAGADPVGTAAGVETTLNNRIDTIELTPGPQGEPGPQGIKGDTGTVGPTGAIGPAGATGSQGAQGVKGDKGDKGDTGTAGATGPVGAPGVAGPQGVKGDKGDTGNTGPAGAPGAAGVAGVKGDQGDPGPQGIKGDIGNTGAAGPAGTQGVKGDIGNTGPQGNPGATGPQGNPGVAGAAGTPGSVWRNGSGAPSNATGVDGDYYLNTSTGDVYQRATGTYSIIANIKGPTGATGGTGAAGAAGSVWRNGSGVPSNATGVDGDYFLNTSSGDVYQRSSGTYAVVGNIKGPTGATGAQGSAGPTGATGPQGPQGSAGTTTVFGASGGTHALGAVPDPGSVAGTAKYLREDATWATPAGGGGGTVMGPSGTAHAAGSAPDPGSTAGTTKFLREDATWAAPAGGGGSPSIAYTNSGTVSSGGTLVVTHPSDPAPRKRVVSAYAPLPGPNQVPAMTGNAAPSGTASASDIYGTGYEAYRAFDRVTSAGGYASTASAPPHWLQYQFPAGTVISSYTLTVVNAISGQEPKSWTFAGSNDGSAWNTLDTQTNVAAWVASEKRTYAAPNSVAYPYYRVNFTASQSSNIVQLDQLELFTPPVDTEMALGATGVGVTMADTSTTLTNNTAGPLVLTGLVALASSTVNYSSNASSSQISSGSANVAAGGTLVISHAADPAPRRRLVSAYAPGIGSNAVPTMTSATTPSGTASSSTNYSGSNVEYLAFDHSTAAAGWASSTVPAWLQYRFPSAQTIVGYTISIWSGGNGYTQGQMPNTWTFLGSNDGSTWATLDTRSGAASWTPGEKRTYTFANTTAYLYYRINVTVVNGQGLVEIDELELLPLGGDMEQPIGTSTGVGVSMADATTTLTNNTTGGLALTGVVAVPAGVANSYSGTGTVANGGTLVISHASDPIPRTRVVQAYDSAGNTELAIGTSTGIAVNVTDTTTTLVNNTGGTLALTGVVLLGLSTGATIPAMGPSGATHQGGMAPDPGSVAGTTKFLREDASWVVPSASTMVGSGTAHAGGSAPDPGVTAGTTRFLREDATWTTAVTSVGLAMPNFFNTTASPLTTAGTITVGMGPQGVGKVLAGPTVGSATPAFRALAGSDIPIFAASGAGTTKGGVPTPSTTAGTAKFLCENSTWKVPGTTTVTLTYGATIATDASLGTLFHVTLSGNANLAYPTGMVDGQRMVWRVWQDNVGNRTLTYDASFAWPNGTPPTLSTAAQKTDYLIGYYSAISGHIDMTGPAALGF